MRADLLNRRIILSQATDTGQVGSDKQTRPFIAQQGS
jgi:hypothetical protein